MKKLFRLRVVWTLLIAWLMGGMLWADEGACGLRIGLEGTDSALWFYDHGEDLGSNLLRFYLRIEGRDDFVQPAALRNLVGCVHALAGSGTILHVFFDDGSHRRYGVDQLAIVGHTEQPLPQKQLPLALVAGLGQRTLLAIVSVATAQQIQQQALEQWQASASANINENIDATLSEPWIIQSYDWDRSVYALVSYVNRRWRVETTLPTHIDLIRSPRLAWDRQEKLHLLFQDGSGIWRYLIQAEGLWSEFALCPDLQMHSVIGLHSMPDRTVIISREDVPSGIKIYTHWKDEVGSWQHGADILLDFNALQSPHFGFTQTGGSARVSPRRINFTRGSERSETPLPNGRGSEGYEISSGWFGKTLVLAVAGNQLPPHYSRWPLGGGSPHESWRQIHDFGRQPSSGLSTPLQTLLSFVGLAMILGYVFWRRQESISQPLQLPAQYVIASLWRRAFGFMLDFAPATLTTYRWWGPVLVRSLDAYRALESQDDPMPLLSDDLLQSWLLACGAYMLYCFLFEAVFATTPGKLAVRCRVVNENGHRCDFKQIVIRNLLKLLELFPLFQLLPTLILLLFTRNRQRLGDLLARTVVVERLESARQRTSSGNFPSY